MGDHLNIGHDHSVPIAGNRIQHAFHINFAEAYIPEDRDGIPEARWEKVPYFPNNLKNDIDGFFFHFFNDLVDNCLGFLPHICEPTWHYINKEVFYLVREFCQLALNPANRTAFRIFTKVKHAIRPIPSEAFLVTKLKSIGPC